MCHAIVCSYEIYFWTLLTEHPIVLSLDVMDISGEQQRDLTHNIMKTRLNPQGEAIEDVSAGLGSDLDKAVAGKGEGYCGSCYGGLNPPTGCCNTCEEVRQSYVNRGWSFSNPDAIEQVRRDPVLSDNLMRSGVVRFRRLVRKDQRPGS